MLSLICMLHLESCFFRATSDSDRQMLQISLLLWALSLAHSLTLNLHSSVVKPFRLPHDRLRQRPSNGQCRA